MGESKRQEASLWQRIGQNIRYCINGVWEDTRTLWSVKTVKIINLSVRSFLDRDLRQRAGSLTYNTVLEHFETSSYIIDDTVYYCIAAKGQIIIDLYDTNPNGRDCYYISIIESDFYDIQKFTFNDPIFENINEPVLDEIYSTSRPFFSDKIFDGSQYQLKIPFVISSINNTEYTSEAEFEIVLEHIDMNLYEYYNTLYVANSDDYGPLSEPAHIHSNVNGGYGIVAGQNCDTIIIKVSQER